MFKPLHIHLKLQNTGNECPYVYSPSIKAESVCRLPST